MALKRGSPADLIDSSAQSSDALTDSLVPPAPRCSGSGALRCSSFTARRVSKPHLKTASRSLSGGLSSQPNLAVMPLQVFPLQEGGGYTGVSLLIRIDDRYYIPRRGQMEPIAMKM